jgi:hypothetical protein
MTGEKLKLKNVRLAFTQNLFTPGSYKNEPGKKKKYSAKFLIPKLGPDGLVNPVVVAIKDELMRLATLEWKDKVEQVIKELRAENKICLYDGDIKSYDGYAGHYYISASNETKPLYLRANPGTKDKPNLITEESGELYSGCYVVAQISFWTQNNSFGKRINANLLGVQFYRPGEAFSGGGTASVDEFEAVDGETNTVGGGSASDLFT